MKRITILTFLFISLFSVPLIAFAGTLFSSGMTVYYVNSTNNSNYPASTANPRPDATDGTLSTCVTMAANSAIYGSFGTKKIIDEFNFRTGTNFNFTGDIYFYDQNKNPVLTNLDSALSGAVNPPVTAYYFKLVNDDSVNRFLCEVLLYEIDDTFPPNAPVLTNAIGGNLSVTLNWTKPLDVDVDGYYIYKNGLKSATKTDENTLTHTVTGLAPNESNNFTVSAYDDSNNESAQSNTVVGSAIDTTKPTTPTGLESTPYDNKVSLIWNASTDNHTVQKYNVYVNGSFYDDTENTFMTVSGLFNEYNYQFTVKAVDPSGNESLGANINEIPLDTEPPYQKAPTTGLITENSIQMLWDFSDSVDIEKYEVTRNNFSTFETVYHVANTQYSYTFTGLNSGQNYTLRVRAVDDDGLKSAPEIIIATTSVDPPAVPQNIILTPDDNEIKIDWDDSTAPDIDGYKIYVDGNYLTTVTSSIYTHTGLQNKSLKCYQISAFDENNNESNKTSSYCAEPVDNKPPFDISEIDTISSTEYSYTFGWEKKPGEDTAYFKVYKNNSPICCNVPYQTGVDYYTYTANNLIPNTIYTFQVNPVDDDGNELFTGTNGKIEISTFSTAPTPPTGLTATSGEGSVTLNWNEHNETDVENYKIYVNGSLLATVDKNTLTYTHNTMNPNSKSYYIKAVDLGGAESGQSNTVNASPVILAPVPLFENANIGIQATDIVESSFNLVSLLKWFIVIGLALWFAWKIIQSMKFSLNSNSSAPTIDNNGSKIVEKKLEEQKEQQKMIERIKERINKKR
jgi:hypothetical protein